MKTIAEALAEMLPAFAPRGVMRVGLHDALGLVLAEPLVARFESPPFDNSAMDGYAVHAAALTGASAEHPIVLPLGGESRAGGPTPPALTPGACMRIFTGAPMPAGADAVVMQEASSDSVIDRFEEGGIGTSTIGKPVTWTGFVAFDEYFFDRSPNATFDHYTRGAYGEWTAVGPSHRTELQPFDARTSGFLSFRAAQVAQEYNPVTSDLVFDIVVSDGSTSRAVASLDVTRIPAPYDPGNVPMGPTARRTVMRTVRVPLSCVVPPGATLDLSHLTSIELRPRGTSGRYAVDDLAFAN